MSDATKQAERVSDDDLAEVARLDGEATAEMVYGATPDGGFVVLGVQDDENGHADDDPQLGWFEREEDARMAVRYRTLAPRLAAEVVALRADLAALRALKVPEVEAALARFADRVGVTGPMPRPPVQP